LTLDGEPALDVLLKDLGVSLQEPRAAIAKVQHTLVGLSESDQHALGKSGHFEEAVVVRHIIGLDPAKRGIAVAHTLSVGQSLTFCTRNPQAAKADLMRMGTQIRDSLEPQDWPQNWPQEVQDAWVQTELSEPHPARKVLGNAGLVGNSPFTASLSFGEVLTVNTASAISSVNSDSVANSLDKAYWGVRTKQTSNKLFNPQVRDGLRTLPFNVSAGSLAYSFFFSLDDVKFLGAVTNVNDTTGITSSVAYWAEGNRAGNLSYTSKTAADLSDKYFQSVARFTVPLVGGFSGLNITE